MLNVIKCFLDGNNHTALILYCVMAACLNKDIQYHVWPYSTGVSRLFKFTYFYACKSPEQTLLVGNK